MTMSIPEKGKQEYIEAYSHHKLASAWGVSLNTLDTYASDHGWDREHKLYWQDRALEVLKMQAEEHNLVAVRELLKAVGIARPVGRPSKADVQKHIAIEAKIADEYEQDAARLRVVGK